MAYNEDSSFKLKSALKDGSNPPFKAMGATDAPTKFGFDKKRKTEIEEFRQEQFHQSFIKEKNDRTR